MADSQNPSRPIPRRNRSPQFWSFLPSPYRQNWHPINTGMPFPNAYPRTRNTPKAILKALVMSMVVYLFLYVRRGPLRIVGDSL